MPIEISWGIFAQSISILLREGLEALLVVAALVAYLQKSGASSHIRAVFAGAVGGVILSILAAIVLELFFEGQDNILQGASFLAAAGLMVYVSGWLFIRQDPRAWQAYLHSHAEQALTSGNVIWAVGLLSCLSVLREGAETALFYHALARSEDGWSISIFAGIGSAVIVLGLLFAVMQAVTVRIPLRPLFIVTSAFLLVMALKFIGNGLSELQEIEILPKSIAQLPEWWEAFGLNPSWEALIAQTIVLLGVVVTFSALHLGLGSKPSAH